MLKLVHLLFNEIHFYADHINKKNFIGEPTIGQFTARLAEEFQLIYGPRKLASFIARCQLLGPWAETVEGQKKIFGEMRKVRFSKYEQELAGLQRRDNKYVELSQNDIKRYEELMTLLPDSMASKSDEELTKDLKIWTEQQRIMKPNYPLMSF